MDNICEESEASVKLDFNSMMRNFLRQYLKMLVKIPTYCIYVAAVLERVVRKDNSVRILMYHSTGNIPKEHWDHYDNVPVPRFRSQMEYLKRRYKVISLSDLVRLQEQRKCLESRSIVISFDDGYRNQFLYAYPILKRLGLSAVFFVVTNYIGASRPLYHLQTAQENFSESTEALPLRWEDIEEMSADMIIGSHSCSHRSVGSLPDSEAATEIFESKHMLEQRLGKPIDHFSYPFGSQAYGDFNDRTTELLQKAGYKTACTTVVGANKELLDLYRLKRIPVEASDSVFDLECKLSGAYDWVGPFKTRFQRIFGKRSFA